MTFAARVFLVALLALLARGASAQSLTTYDGCVDADGRPVAAVLDATLAAVVATRVAASGAVTIAYNPQALPRLGQAARLFLFAHECARHHLGIVPHAVRSLEDARRADCDGLAMMRRSALLDGTALDEIEADLRLSADEWPYVPGPARALALRSCAATSTPPPSLGAPPAAQPQWNACVRACGEPLRACRGACGGGRCDACEQRYEQCSSLCDFRFAP